MEVSSIVYVLISVLCSVSRLRRVFGVYPMYWLHLVHLMHSSK